MSVCCTFQLIFVNKSTLTADIALLPTGAFRTFANLTKKLCVLHHIYKKYTYLTFVTNTSKKCTSLLKKSKYFYLSKVTK